MQHRFRFSSLLAHMFLHQNPDFFRHRLGLAVFDESGVRRMVSMCTFLLSATYDYYAFFESFLTLILRDFSEDGKIYQLSTEQTRWMQNFLPPCDWFLGEDFTFVRLHGFTEEPFQLLVCVTNRVFSLEVFRQLAIIDLNFYRGKKKKGFFLCPLTFGGVIMLKKQTHGLLEVKLAHLGLLLICEK